ncbi:hypothetical protein E2542_SST09152 [Spatholobus suberectus]|nr:hypothetical protein E2542_SST09152 [Spatholobus suberectus]
MAHTNAMNYSPLNVIPTREEEVTRFRELQNIFDNFFKWLFGVIAFKTTAAGEDLFMAHPIIMMAMILMIVLYFSLWLFGTMLPWCTGIFLMILVFIMMVIASVFSVLGVTIVSSLLAGLNVMLWVGLFALSAYYCYQELCELVARAISDTIKQLIDDYRTQSTRLPV